MLQKFLKKKELKVRRAILKGVYEDNMRIIGRHSNTVSRRMSFPLNKIIFVFFVSLIIILGQGNYLTSTFSPEKQATANYTTQSIAPQPLTIFTDNPSDYKAFLGKPNMNLSRTFGLGVKTIMIDPGHGGADPGTIGKMGTKEKDIVLDIAKRLKAHLIRKGHYNVLMTRDEDITLPLNKRVELAGLSKADIFISIHLNYLPSKPINIIETYYFGPSADDAILRLAEKENAGSSYGMSDFKEMIEKMGEKLKLQESQEFAAAIQKNLFLNSRKQNGSVQNFGVKRAPFVVLLGVDVPAVLAEVSCLSNKDEEIELNTEVHREHLARYIEAGILDYLNKGEVNNEAKRFAERR